MTDKIECPFCKKEFDAEMWQDGNCPSCNEPYCWDEQCTEDYSDCWPIVDWDWEKLNDKSSS